MALGQHDAEYLFVVRGVQRELPGKFALDVSYSGNHAIHLMDQRRVNAVPAGTFVTNPNLRQSVNFKDDALRPYYGWGSLNAVETLAYSRYNAMMVRAEPALRQQPCGQLQLHPVQGHGLVGQRLRQHHQPIQHAPELGKSRLRPDQRVHHRLRLRSSEGEGSTGQASGDGGLKWLGSHRDVPRPIGDADSPSAPTDRPWEWIPAASTPNLVGDPYAGQNKYGWLNPAAFQRPADGQYGNLQRNALRMPGVRNVDASLMKNFAITESTKVALRCEVFNLFNHPQIWGHQHRILRGQSGRRRFPASNKNFGQPNSWREARIMQLALRFSF